MATVPHNGTHPHSTDDTPTHGAWMTACAQAAERLGSTYDEERVRKARSLAQEGAVTLAATGSASVKSGPTRYQVSADGTCYCPDAQHHGPGCKHALAVQIHALAWAALQPGGDHTHAPGWEAPSTPTATTPAALEAAYAQIQARQAARQRPTRQPSGPASAAWDVHEAPISSCFRYRVGSMEWTHTIRGATDGEVEQRLTDFVSTFREIVAGLDALHAERATAHAAPAPVAPPSPAAPPDVAALVRQAVQQALAAAAQGPAASAPPAAEADDQASGVCSLHDVAMDQRTDAASGERWYSHYDEATGRYCKGRRPSRRSRR